MTCTLGICCQIERSRYVINLIGTAILLCDSCTVLWQEKDDIDTVVVPDLDDLLKDSEDGESGASEEDIVDKFMEEKFFKDEDGDEDEPDEDEPLPMKDDSEEEEEEKKEL